MRTKINPNSLANLKPGSEPRRHRERKTKRLPATLTPTDKAIFLALLKDAGYNGITDLIECFVDGLKLPKKP